MPEISKYRTSHPVLVFHEKPTTLRPGDLIALEAGGLVTITRGTELIRYNDLNPEFASPHSDNKLLVNDLNIRGFHGLVQLLAAASRLRFQKVDHIRGRLVFQFLAPT